MVRQLHILLSIPFIAIFLAVASRPVAEENVDVCKALSEGLQEASEKYPNWLPQNYVEMLNNMTYPCPGDVQIPLSSAVVVAMLKVRDGFLKLKEYGLDYKMDEVFEQNLKMLTDPAAERFMLNQWADFRNITETFYAGEIPPFELLSHIATVRPYQFSNLPQSASDEIWEVFPQYASIMNKTNELRGLLAEPLLLN